MPTEPRADLHQFHQLWTESVGKPGYVKARWSALHVAMFRCPEKHDELLVIASILRDHDCAPGEQAR